MDFNSIIVLTIKKFQVVRQLVNSILKLVIKIEHVQTKRDDEKVKKNTIQYKDRTSIFVAIYANIILSLLNALRGHQT